MPVRTTKKKNGRRTASSPKHGYFERAVLEPAGRLIGALTSTIRWGVKAIAR